MRVTVEVVGGETHEVVADGEETYADLLGPTDLNPHTVSVVVDGSPVPVDQPVATDHVRVVRLVKGG